MSGSPRLDGDPAPPSMVDVRVNSIDDTNKELIVEHMDSTIYKAALDALIERGENKDFYEKLAAEYAKHNTLGI